MSRNLMACILFGIFLITGVWYCDYKLSALSFHTRDFAYYLEFYFKAFRPDFLQQLSLNPEGINFIGYSGTDAARNLYESVHFEPIKYVLALILKPFALVVPSRVFPLLVFALHCSVLLSPILYLGFTVPMTKRAHLRYFAVAACAYFFYFSTLQTITFDLRTFSYLIPALICLVIALTQKRSPLHIAIALNALLAIREEALLLVLPLPFFVAVLFSTKSDQKYRSALFKIFLASISFWLICALSYFLFLDLWSPAGLKQFAVRLIGFLSINAAVYGGFLFFRKKTKSTSQQNLSLVFASIFIGLVYLLFLFQYLSSHQNHIGTALRGVTELLWYPRYHLLGCLPLLLSTALFAHFKKVWNKLAWVSVLGILLASIAFQASGHRKSLASNLKAFAERKTNYEWLFSNKRNWNGKAKAVLTDYTHHQAFYDFNALYVFERLPVYIVKGQERFYPQNRSHLAKIVDQIDLIAVTPEHLKAIKEEIKPTLRIKSLFSSKNLVVAEVQH